VERAVTWREGGEGDTPGPGVGEAQLSARRAEAALERYGIRNARLRLLRSGFKQVFRVTSPTGEEFALRMYGLPHADVETRSPDVGLRTGATLRSPDALRAQLTWLSALASETDLLVPEPVRTLEGSLVGHVSVEGVPGERHFTLVRWVSGRSKKEDLSPADFALAGSFVGRLHRHAARYASAEDAALPRWDWYWPFGDSVPLWSIGEVFYSSEQMAVFEAAARRVREDLEALGEGRDVFGVIHRDLGLDNLVFRDGTVGAIDFDLCGLGHYLLDVAAAIASLRPFHVERLDLMCESFFEGYDRERPLPAGYRRHLRTFDVMRRVAAINRQISLLSAGDDEETRGDRFLRNSVTWLRRNYL
jgi:Ser/Thr protein kinase RdoA (MazF antagonist)